jgi:hypothetical protein
MSAHSGQSMARTVVDAPRTSLCGSWRVSILISLNADNYRADRSCIRDAIQSALSSPSDAWLFGLLQCFRR